MGRNNFVADLSPEMRVELHKRLLESSFSHYDELAEWLTENGHPVSKSAVHRYGQTLESEIDEQVGLRMRCVEAAAKISTETSVIATAELLLASAKKGRAESLG